MKIGKFAPSLPINHFRQTVAKIRKPYAESHWSASRIATRVFFMTFLISAAGIEGFPEDTPFEQGFDNFVGNAATLTFVPATLYGCLKKPLRIASLTAFAVRFLFGFHVGWFLSLPFSILNEAVRVRSAKKSLFANQESYRADLQKALAHEEITPEVITHELLSLGWRFLGRRGAKFANGLILDVLGDTVPEKNDPVLLLLNESRKGRAVVRQAAWAK